MSDYIFKTLIVPATIAEQCRALAVALAGPAAEGMWTTPCVIDGALHYISSGAVGAEFAAVLASPDAMHAACQVAGLPATLEQCEAILAAAIVIDLDEEPVAETFARLGVQLVEGEV